MPHTPPPVVVEQRSGASQVAKPPEMLLAVQQGCPALPQGMQVAPLQVVPLALQMRPLQQGWPAAPHPPHDPSAPQVPTVIEQL
jgi:hypothetical protein